MISLGATPGVDSYLCWIKFKLQCLLQIFIYTNAKFTVIFKTPTLNNGKWRSILTENEKKKKKKKKKMKKKKKKENGFLVAATLLFIGKIIII